MITSIIADGAKELNIDLPPGTGAAFEAYNDFLKKCGEFVNLTAISGVEEVARLHFLDSLALLNVVNFKQTKVIDVGSGAGFPGLPLKIAEPSLELTLLDATGKRVSFLTDLCNVLSIEAICVYARAEDAGHKAENREQYDVAVSRAVAQLNILSELCLPFVRVNGFFLAMKSLDTNTELDEARNAYTTLGAELQETRDYTIPGTDITHRVYVIRKTSETPKRYPRRYARIQNSPL